MKDTSAPKDEVFMLLPPLQLTAIHIAMMERRYLAFVLRCGEARIRPGKMNFRFGRVGGAEPVRSDADSVTSHGFSAAGDVFGINSGLRAHLH